MWVDVVNPKEAEALDPVEEAERARFAAVQALKARLSVEEEAERSRLRAEETLQAQRVAEEQAEKAALAAKEAEEARATAEQEAESARLAAEEALQSWRTKLAAEEAEKSRRERSPDVEAAGSLKEAEPAAALEPEPEVDLEDTLDEEVSKRTTEASVEHEELEEEPDAADEEEEVVPLLRPPLEDEPPVTSPRYLTCVISYWRGYRKAAFYARAFDEDGHELVLTESEEFKAKGNGIPDPTEQAIEAHEALIDQLRRDGWEPVDRDETWFGQTLRRRVSAAAELAPKETLDSQLGLGPTG
jgi:hypothetical protein